MRSTIGRARNVGPRPVVLAVAAMMLAWTVGGMLAARDAVDSPAQQPAASSQKLPMSEEAFKNIRR